MQISPTLTRQLAGVLGVCLLFVAGCTKKAQPASVEGNVTFKGVPIEEGAIRFISETGDIKHAGIGSIENGRYSIPSGNSLKEGTYLVSIYGFKETGRTIFVSDDLPPEKEKRQYVPRNHNDETTIRIDLLAGENNHDFALQ